MNNWSRVEETNFRELVRRAEEQSREYYSRGKAKAPPRQAPARPVASSSFSDYCRPVLCLPPPPPLAPPPPPLPPPPAHHRVEARVRPAQPCPKPAGGVGDVLGGLLGGIDTETLLLAGLLWLLAEEKADLKIILALIYILIV